MEWSEESEMLRRPTSSDGVIMAKVLIEFAGVMAVVVWRLMMIVRVAVMVAGCAGTAVIDARVLVMLLPRLDGGVPT
jgi:hypothetical protein